MSLERLAGVAALALCVAAAVAAGGCGVAEFGCRDGHCVPLDAYCDGAPHCADGSDEPARCTPCNRTYYGRVGRAYSLALPAAPRPPFLCHLTFTAGGGTHGDLVQLAFDEFRVGRYAAGALDGCPDGFVQLAELGRPFTGGSWCGEAGGGALYFSETATVTLSVRLYRTSTPLALRLRYRFLAARDAVVRFGPAQAPLERGAVSPGTYCTRTYEECHRKPCRLQSPNYPGVYPRNVSCYWSLRQKDVPTCKHAMISVRQEHAHKMQIKRSIAMASLNKTGRAVRAWRDCTTERDRLIVYDGGSTDDPVLLEYCGGDWLPPVTSRGPEMLVAFHSSPYSAPPPPAPALRGFELDVAVVFADSDSLEYAREPRRCEFHVKAGSGAEERSRRGILHAPRHTLPPGTTCSWTFHGRPGDLVWIYFASFTHYSLMEQRRETTEREDSTDATFPTPPETTRPDSPWVRLREMLRARPATTTTTTAPREAGDCAVSLQLWDGGGEGEPGVRLMGRYCDEPPRLCARASFTEPGRAPRACSPPDGFVSSATVLSMSASIRPGTATHPLSFALHYEFVEARMPGNPLPGRPVSPPGCARLVTQEGELLSPQNVLWFGRGGGRRLRCLYRIEAKNRIELKFDQLAFGRESRCSTKVDGRTGRLACEPLEVPPEDREDDDDRDLFDELDEDAEPLLRVPHLAVYESPWPGYRVPVACLCDNTSSGLIMSGASGALELEMSARNLRSDEDARHIRWAGTWKQEAGLACARRPDAPGGHITLRHPDPCGAAPLLLRARYNRSVLLRVWGEELVGLEPPPCATANRVLVYEPGGRLLAAVCPGARSESARTVLLSSRDWRSGRGHGALLVVWSAREPGTARVAWLEAWRGADNTTCAHACPELDACTDGALWCDGATDCPRGGDEAGCGGARLLAALGGWRVAGAAAGGAAAAAALVLVASLRRRRHKPPPRPEPGAS